jgi:nucleoside-diphosphate-sugar epimerase
VVSFDLQGVAFSGSSKAESVIGDILDFPALSNAVSECDAVIHCAAALPLHSPSEIWRVDVDGTKNVLEAAIRAGAQRFVHISSTAVYGVGQEPGFAEDGLLIGEGPYGLAKIESERLVRESRSRIAATILRPQSIIGPERLGLFSLLFDWAHSGCNFPILGAGTNRYQFVDVDDLCDAIVACLLVPKLDMNRTFNIGASSFGTFRGDFQALLDHAGFGKRIVSLPLFPVLHLLRLLSALRLSPIYPWVFESAARDNFVSTEQAQRLLRWKPRFSNSEALIRNYDWYTARVGDFALEGGKTHRVPWKQGVLRFAKWFFK